MARNGTAALATESTANSGEDQLHALELQQQYLNPDTTTLDPTLNAILNESNRRAAIIGSLRQRLQEAEKRAEIAEAALQAIRDSKSTDK